MGMRLVFSPNWFPIFICFVKLATEHRFSVLFFSNRRSQTHTQASFFFSLRISGHLQSGCGFCKHNLLRLPRSVSSMHQQPCLSEQHTHTHMHTLMGVDWILYGQQERRRKLLYILPVSSQIPFRPSFMLLELKEAP